jgi:membrane-associated phospholipid phosphatase
MDLFFFAYFWVLRHRAFPVTLMPLTALDRAIPFWPGAVVFYVSLWLYVSLAPALLTTKRELVSHAAAWTVVSVVGLIVFYFSPTAVPVQLVNGTPATGLGFLWTIDASGNACPSLHVAFAVLTAVWFERLLRETGAGAAVRVGNGIWCAAIVYSTMAIRQHVALDVLAGAGLGLAVAFAHTWWMQRFPG